MLKWLAKLFGSVEMIEPEAGSPVPQESARTNPLLIHHPECLSLLQHNRFSSWKIQMQGDTFYDLTARLKMVVEFIRTERTIPHYTMQFPVQSVFVSDYFGIAKVESIAIEYNEAVVFLQQWCTDNEEKRYDDPMVSYYLRVIQQCFKLLETPMSEINNGIQRHFGGDRG